MHVHISSVCNSENFSKSARAERTLVVKNIAIVACAGCASTLQSYLCFEGPIGTSVFAFLFGMHWSAKRLVCAATSDF